jgi:predicted CopG family antitoxin
MQRKLTITIDQQVYEALHQQVGRGNISAFIESLVRPRVKTEADLEAGYLAMMEDEEAEREALEWIEGLIGDSAP